MKIFLDSADTAEISKYSSYGFVDGVTTNPSIIAKSGQDFKTVIKQIASINSGPVSAEVISLDYESMIKEADDLCKIAKNVCIKLPLTQDGLRACKTLSSKGVMVNVTLCFSVSQAFFAAKCGATFISPFVGRWDDIGIDGMGLIKDIKTVYSNYGFKTQILVASVRDPIHVLEALQIGADVATIPPSLMDKLIKHPLTDKGIETFLKDWSSISK